MTDYEKALYWYKKGIREYFIGSALLEKFQELYGSYFDRDGKLIKPLD